MEGLLDEQPKLLTALTAVVEKPKAKRYEIIFETKPERQQSLDLTKVVHLSKEFKQFTLVTRK